MGYGAQDESPVDGATDFEFMCNKRRAAGTNIAALSILLTAKWSPEVPSDTSIYPLTPHTPIGWRELSWNKLLFSGEPEANGILGYWYGPTTVFILCFRIPEVAGALQR